MQPVVQFGEMVGSGFSSLLILIGISLMLGFHWETMKEKEEYKAEIIRQEAVIKEQHGKLCMLSGILSNEIPKFKLEWVDLECP
jgi:hypothetical protein